MRIYTQRPDHNTRNYVPYSLRTVSVFFNVPQSYLRTRVVRRGLRFIVLIHKLKKNNNKNSQSQTACSTALGMTPRTSNLESPSPPPPPSYCNCIWRCHGDFCCILVKTAQTCDEKPFCQHEIAVVRTLERILIKGFLQGRTDFCKIYKKNLKKLANFLKLQSISIQCHPQPNIMSSICAIVGLLK